jgi:hypothetical protein
VLNQMTMRQNNWTLGAYCAAYCTVITQHHGLEDRVIFPGLRRADPALSQPGALARMEVSANVLTRPYLAAIDPASGQVTDIVDARAARARFPRDPDAFMNGIATIAAPGEFLLTGKRWRWLYHVRLTASRRDLPPERLTGP